MRQLHIPCQAARSGSPWHYLIATCTGTTSLNAACNELKAQRTLHTHTKCADKTAAVRLSWHVTACDHNVAARMRPKHIYTPLDKTYCPFAATSPCRTRPQPQPQQSATYGHTNARDHMGHVRQPQPPIQNNAQANVSICYMCTNSIPREPKAPACPHTCNIKSLEDPVRHRCHPRLVCADTCPCPSWLSQPASCFVLPSA
jgi:hypothetical protein